VGVASTETADSVHSSSLLDEIPEHGPAELYPEDPVLEVEYIMQRFKRVMESVPEEVSCLPFSLHIPAPSCHIHCAVFVTMRGEAWDGATSHDGLVRVLLFESLTSRCVIAA
jgi:hypothetical protein